MIVFTSTVSNFTTKGLENVSYLDLCEVTCPLERPWRIYRKSLRPSDAYVHQLTRASMVQIMACRLIGTMPWTNAGIVFIEIWIEIYTASFQGNTFENVVCETAATLSRPQCVKQSDTESGIFEITTSIQFWTKPWLFASPDHQQQWFWLCKIYWHVYPQAERFQLPTSTNLVWKYDRKLAS